MFDIPCCFWQTHSWMTVNNLQSTELRSGLLGGYVWCEVCMESCVTAAQWLCAHVVRWKAKVASSLTDVWQQLFEQQDITVICSIHCHLWLHKNHTSAPEPGDTDWSYRHAGTCLSETNEGRLWAEASSDWNVVSNQQGFIDQAIDQWQDCSNACLKAKSNTEHLHNISSQVTWLLKLTAVMEKLT